MFCVGKDNNPGSKKPTEQKAPEESIISRVQYLFISRLMLIQVSVNAAIYHLRIGNKAQEHPSDQFRMVQKLHNVRPLFNSQR